MEKILDKYEVVIIGAGVAGLCCARLLANTSLNVLIVEKKVTPGDKLCTGILLPSIPSEYYPIEKTTEVESYYVKFSPEGGYKESSQPMRFISRVDLGTHLFNRLEGASNITLVTGALVKQICSQTIYVNSQQIAFDVLVGADGSNSIVREFLKLKSKKLLCLVYETEKTNRDTIIEIFNYLRKGYGWITSLPGSTQAGFLFDRRYMNLTDARSQFHTFLKENNFIFESLQMKAMQINYYYKGILFGNILLVGDAAGLANRRDGEGIYEAIISGEEAAKWILNHSYSFEKMKIILKRKRQGDGLLFIWMYLLPIIQPIKQIFGTLGSIFARSALLKRKR